MRKKELQEKLRCLLVKAWKVAPVGYKYHVILPVKYAKIMKFKKGGTNTVTLVEEDGELIHKILEAKAEISPIITEPLVW